MKVFNQWINEKSKPKDIECSPLYELDTIIQEFYCEMRKRDRKEDGRAFLVAMQVALDTYLRQSHYFDKLTFYKTKGCA